MQNNTQKNADFLYPELSFKIRGACFALYKELGCNHKEVIYQRGLVVKFNSLNLKSEREKQIPVLVDNQKVGIYTPDIIVEDKILLELKASIFTTKQDITQFWYYLKNSSYKLGFLINFGKPGGMEINRRIYDNARQRISA